MDYGPTSPALKVGSGLGIPSAPGVLIPAKTVTLRGRDGTTQAEVQEDGLAPALRAGDGGSSRGLMALTPTAFSAINALVTGDETQTMVGGRLNTMPHVLTGTGPTSSRDLSPPV